MPAAGPLGHSGFQRRSLKATKCLNGRANIAMEPMSQPRRVSKRRKSGSAGDALDSAPTRVRRTYGQVHVRRDSIALLRRESGCRATGVGYVLVARQWEQPSVRHLQHSKPGFITTAVPFRALASPLDISPVSTGPKGLSTSPCFGTCERQCHQAKGADLAPLTTEREQLEKLFTIKGVLDDCGLRFVQKCRRSPQKYPRFWGSNFEKNHGHAALPKSYQIDELTSQTFQSHVSYTYLPSALEIAN